MSLLLPAYLLGLAALALPWILHRFSDHEPPLQLFPSKRFLEATTPPVSRKRTLRYKALLALRVLGLLLLCLLFAQPWINRDVVSASEQRHHIVVIDQSFSMRAGDRWAAALERAGQLINDLGTANVELVGFDSSVSLLASRIAGEPESSPSIENVLASLQPGYEPGDYGVLMQRLDRLASEQTLPVKVTLVSDMQQSSLPAQLNALFSPAVDELELMSVPTDNETNVHLIAKAESTDDATATINVSLLASSTSPGSEPVERTVQVETRERIVEQRSVSLMPGELQLISFDELVLPAESDPQFIVSLLQDDSLQEDNRQILPVVAAKPAGVVILESDNRSAGSASVFLTTALETDEVASVEIIRGTVLQVPPDTPHLVIGRDLSTALDIDVLQFVDNGSNALVFNQAESATDSDVIVDGVGVGSIYEAHPLALGDINWFGTRFYEIPQFAPEPQDQILLQTTDGQAILIERTTERGRLLIINDPLDGLASNLPLQPAFVELMQSLLQYFDASTAVPSVVIIGERLALPANVQLIDSSGQALRDLADSAISSTVQLSEPGNYTVLSVRGEQSLRAVLDPDEADITPLSADALSAWQARFDVAQEPATGDNEQSEPAVRIDPVALLGNEDPLRQSLWQWLMPLLALLLFAEGWFANRRLDVRRDGS